MARNIMLSFGLITFAAKLDTATEKAVEMKNLCTGSNGQAAHDPKPLSAPRACSDCGVITDYAGIKKGIKQGSSYVVVEQEDVKQAKIKNTEAYKGKVNLVPHPSEDFLSHTAPGDSIYYITPADAAAADHYQLIVKLVKDHPELSFASLYTPVSAAGLYMVAVRDDVLVLEQRTRGQAMKAAPSVGGGVNDQLFGMLEAALATFVTPYDPDAYEDKYATAIADLAATAGTVVALGSKEKQVAAAEAVLASDDDIMAKLAELAKGAA